MHSTSPPMKSIGLENICALEYADYTNDDTIHCEPHKLATLYEFYHPFAGYAATMNDARKPIIMAPTPTAGCVEASAERNFTRSRTASPRIGIITIKKEN